MALPLSARRKTSTPKIVDLVDRDDAARRRCSATARSPCIPTTSATSIWSANWCGCRWPSRLIPIIADEYPDPEKGSGAVKITAAHDFNDFEVWTRHRDKDYFKKQLNGGLINLFTPEAKMNENCPAAISRAGSLTKRASASSPTSKRSGWSTRSRPITHAVPHGDRSNVVIEPYLTDQWYVERARTGEAGDRRGARRQDQIRPEELGERPISTGWKTSSPGASRASSGGATRFRRGTGRTAKCSSR